MTEVSADNARSWVFRVIRTPASRVTRCRHPVQ